MEECSHEAETSNLLLGQQKALMWERWQQGASLQKLTALGTAMRQLKVHIAAGLHVGLSRDEILEAIIQMSLYAGFPAALNGVFAAKEVFAELDVA